MRLYQRVVLAATAVVLLMMVPAVGLAGASPTRVQPATCTGGVAVGHFAVIGEDGKHRLEFSIDRVKPASTWAVVLKHNGLRFWHGERIATSTGEFNVRTVATNLKGPDTFFAKATNSRSGEVCTAVITH